MVSKDACHVRVWNENALRPYVVSPVELVIKDPLAGVGHAHLVEIRKGQPKAKGEFLGLFVNGVDFRSQVVAGMDEVGQ
jgi:hypothetical protein